MQKNFLLLLTCGIRKFFLPSILALTLILFWITQIQADDPSALDITLNNTGVVTTSLGLSDFGEEIAIQADGKIVVAGSAGGVDPSQKQSFTVVRYNVDGSLDTSFNNTGCVTTAISSEHDYGSAVTIQPDGKIVIAGSNLTFPIASFGVVRYNQNGSLDYTFNGTGIVTTTVDLPNAGANDIAIQPDGKLVVVGDSADIVYSQSDIVVIRYQTNGELDPGFNGTGIATTSINSINHGMAVAIQPDEKIVVAGYTENPDGLADIAVVRYQSNGVLDHTFNTTGIVTTHITTDQRAFAVAIQPDKKILVSGSSRRGDEWSSGTTTLVRYQNNGELDTSFNNTGIVTTPISSGFNTSSALAVSSIGKIISVGGSDRETNGLVALGDHGYFNYGYYDFAVTRYTNDGNLDTTFNNTGVLTTRLGVSGVGASVAIQSEGKILVAGSSTNGDGTEITLIRYMGSPLENMFLPIILK